MFLANGKFSPSKGNKIRSMSQAKRINAIMSASSFYDESGDFTFRVDFSGKSGVDGGIVAIYPDKYSIAVWSTKLNE